MDAALIPLLLATLRLATPLCLAALGEIVAERAGVLNIGIEGMMLAGAFAAFLVGAQTGWPLPAARAGAAAGLGMAGIFAFFALTRGADPIVCGAALNLLALGATGTLYRLLFPPEVGQSLVPAWSGPVPGLNPFLLLPPTFSPW